MKPPVARTIPMTDAERMAYLTGTPYDPVVPPGGLWGTLGVDFDGNKGALTDVPTTEVITHDENQLTIEDVL